MTDVLKGFPAIPATLPFNEVVFVVEKHLNSAISGYYSYEQLGGAHHDIITRLVGSLTYQNVHPGIVAALLIVRMRLGVSSRDVISGRLCKTRALIAELVAEQFVEKQAGEGKRLEYVAWEGELEEGEAAVAATGATDESYQSFERSFLPGDRSLEAHEESADGSFRGAGFSDSEQQRSYADRSYVDESYQPIDPYNTLEECSNTTALELAVYSSAKHFLANPTIQQILNDIWTGRIVFWKDINMTSHKQPHLYPSAYVLAMRCIPDAYTRLRVPRYRQFFMTINYVILLCLYFSLLFLQKKADDYFEMNFTVVEIVLDIWFLGFVVEKFAQEGDRYWSTFDLLVNLDFLVFLILRTYAFTVNDIRLTKLSFDVLSLEAILLFPRVFSLLSIYPYYGILLPCLRTLTKDFLKFTTIIAICYFGFLTTFAFLGRGDFTTNEMFWLLVRVFFGSSFAGFDEAPKIHPLFGSLLMLVFVMLTNVLLLTVLISILSTRFSKMMSNAREEYILLFAESVVEATSDRVTYLYPPLNLIPLLLRPLRLVLSKSQQRQLKIITLKVSHFPLVVLIWLFENTVVLYHQRVARRARRRVQKRVTERKRRPRAVSAVEEEQQLLGGDGIAVGVRW